MARTYRSESAASLAIARTVRAHAQTREDWRAILAKREAKRTDRHFRQGRRAYSSSLTGSASIRILAVILCVTVALGSFVQAGRFAVRAVAAAHAHSQCDAPIRACDSDSNCRAMVADCV